jgi:sugar O-acyltransferase (sialic acid O-acetyltransferase NeuD family)
MSTVSLLLVGAGAHAASCIDVVEQHGGFRIVGLVGTPEEVGERVLGYEVLGSDALLPELATSVGRALVSVGHIKTAVTRMRIFELLRALGFELPTVISPRAWVSPHANIGAGSIVMHGAIVNARARVGRNCILNTQSLVEHDAHVADHCHIATGAILNGGTSVGEGTFVGSNSCVRQEIRIGARCVVGMGERVLADCADDTTLPPAAVR